MNAQITHRWSTVTVVVIVLLAALAFAGCSAGTTPGQEASSPEAQQLAIQLGDTLTAAGLPVPPTQVLTILYGADGGVSCTNVAALQHQAGLTGFGSPSIGRRVMMDPKVLAYDEAVVATYCPDLLPAYQAYVTGLATATTIP
ncbi:MAG: hypothetical protein IPK16_14660 [Anaerolineales bacterium]|nr:hypothetical protein [Anaerolineales bacterium]